MTEDEIIREISKLVAEETLTVTESSQIKFSEECINQIVIGNQISYFIDLDKFTSTLKNSLKDY